MEKNIHAARWAHISVILSIVWIKSYTTAWTRDSKKETRIHFREQVLQFSSFHYEFFTKVAGSFHVLINHGFCSLTPLIALSVG
jgi:hypothetical protein